MVHLRLLSLLLALVLVAGLGSCGDGDGDRGGDPASEPPEGAADAQGVEGAQVLEVGEPGEIQFELSGGRLSLGEVRPGGGWRFSVEEEDPDEIGVDFSDPDRDVEVDIVAEDGGLNFKVEYERGRPRERQTLVAGNAGEVDFEVDDGALDLLEVRPAEGWQHAADDEEADEIEIDFTSPDGTLVEVEIELD